MITCEIASVYLPLVILATRPDRLARSPFIASSPVWLLLILGSIVNADPLCVNWNDRSSIGARVSHAMAYDSNRGVTVLFGGLNGCHLNETWEWNGTSWTHRKPATSPSIRSGHALAFDSTRGVTVLFGGYNNDNGTNDTWEWDGVTWTERAPAMSPSPRNGHAMAFDSVRQVTVLFGGENGGFLNDTWEWNGITWSERVSTTIPQARFLHAMAHDSTRGVTVMVGGLTSAGTISNHTWEWNGLNWTQRIGGPFRYGHSMAYDSVRGVTVLFGGNTGSAQNPYARDTWEWNGTSWSVRFPTTKPLGRQEQAMAYDSARGVTVLFGGYVDNGVIQYLSDTWEWNGTTWSERVSVTGPSTRKSFAMTYDSLRNVSVLFGGNGSGGLNGFLSDTWEWNGATWTRRSPVTIPPTRSTHAMAYDSTRAKTVLFGGYYYTLFGSFQYLGDTWEWDGLNWTQRSPAVSPAARTHHAMAFDSARGVTVLFGGYYADFNGNAVYFGDTWEWDGTNWMQRSSMTTPSVRYGHAMAYDTSRAVTILFGGLDSKGVDLGDTWEWNGSVWMQLGPTSSPPARHSHAMTYDSVRGTTVLFGGNNGGYLNDTWEWDGMNWTQRSSVTNPAARDSHSMVFENAKGETILFGGYDGCRLGSTWALAIPCILDDDLNGSCDANGLDTSRFITALLFASNATFDLCHADFNLSGVIDEGDISGFVQILLGL